MARNSRVFIEVTELRAISADPLNWMLMKRTKKTDKVTGKPIGGYSEWVSYSYHGDIEGAAASLEKEFQRGSGATTFPELRRAANHIHELMLDTLKEGKV